MSAKNQSYEKILKAATQLFHLQGYHATGLNQILQESGAPKGSLYYHFPNGKEQLAFEVIQLSGQTIAADIQLRLTAFDNPIEAFEQNIQAIVDRFDDFDKMPDFASLPLGLLAAEMALVNENLRQACEDTFMMWEGLYIDKLLAGGYSEKQARLISNSMNALIEGGIMLCLTTKSTEPLAKIKKMIPLLLSK